MTRQQPRAGQEPEPSGGLRPVPWHSAAAKQQPAAGRERSARLEAWERMEEPAIAVLPYGMLVLSCVLSIVLYPHLRQSLVTLGIAAVTAGWILWGFTLHPQWRGQPRRMAVFFAVLAVLMATLVLHSPIFGFFSFTGYFFAYYLGVGWRRTAGVIVIALITATSQNGGLPHPPTAQHIALYAGIIFINVLVAGAFTWFGWVSSEQNDRRKEALADLSEANRKLEATLAENAGLHEQLVTQAREAGVYDERQRMAREIHDTLAQSLAGIITQLQAADQVGRDAERRRHLDAALRLARESLSEARRSVHALRPEPLQGGRIEEALTVVTERWSALHGIAATLTMTGTARPVPPEAELALLRTAQEALANVAKHARASRVGLTLSYFEDQITLDVRDDGVGFAPAVPGTPGTGASVASAPSTEEFRNWGAVPADPVGAAGDSSLNGGFGLTAMRERVEGLAGTLEIESEPGTGTSISASIPLADADPDNGTGTAAGAETEVPAIPDGSAEAGAPAEVGAPAEAGVAAVAVEPR
jgi:signal transduction histidine kinase